MKRIEKKKKLYRTKLAIILAVALVFAIALTLVIYFVGFREEEAKKPEPPEILEGESLYNNYLIAYPTMDESDIQFISIGNETGKFGMVRPDKDGKFTLYYEDSDGNITEHYPQIADEDRNFVYDTLYAIEKDDGYGMVTKLTYLCMALRLPYAEERIELIPEEREEQLAAYGLSEGEYDTVRFVYLDGDGKEKSHTIKIGDPTVLETGYYFMVDDRNYVYAGFADYFKYALSGFYSFVNSILVSPGLKEDSVISAYLTSNYYQWKNEVHKNESDKVAEGSKVIALTEVLLPLHRDDDPDDYELNGDGFITSGPSRLEFDLSEYNKSERYSRIVKALLGKGVGSYLGKEIIFTLTSNSLLLDFTEKAAYRYEYSITGIESVLTDSGELTAVGTPVGDNKLVKLRYRLKIDGSSAAEYDLYAVVDLTDKSLSEDFVNKIKNSSVGAVSESSPINLVIDYTKENSVSQKVEYVITEIVSIFDSKGAEIKKVKEDSIVAYRYCFVIDGERDGEEYITTLNLGTDDSATGAKIKEILSGREVSNDLSLVADEYMEYYEFFMDFMTYSVSEINYFVTSEMVSAFRFLNSSERDPYYGDSIYENTMTNKYAIYGLNNNVCQEVVNILTGISDTSSAPSGLIGSETVAVGITPEVMEKFGLYAYTVYLEIPRGIWTEANPNDPDGVDDYDWYETLGFTLHISEELEDGTRYVGSELYDVVVKIDGSKFVFLKYSFVNFWARRDLMLTDVTYIDNVTVELNLEDMKGAYDLELDHNTVYIGSDNGRYPNSPPTHVTYSEFDEITVNVTPSGECTDNKLLQYIEKMGYSFVSLTEFYNKNTGDGSNQYVRYDPLGTSNFKEFIENVYFTTYDGVVPQESQADIVENSPMILRMSFKLQSSAWRYVYEFYRYSDRCVMVRLYQATYNETTHEYTMKTTPVSDFYVSTFAVKKIINNFVGLLNLEDIDKETGYVD